MDTRQVHLMKTRHARLKSLAKAVQTRASNMQREGRDASKVQRHGACLATRASEIESQLVGSWAHTGTGW